MRNQWKKGFIEAEGGGQEAEMFENKRMYLGSLKPIRGERGRGWVLLMESPPPQSSNRERNFRENPDAILAVPPPPVPALPPGFQEETIASGHSLPFTVTQEPALVQA